MTDVRESVLRRVKKCLMLSKSPNANEAAVALRQAQALMKAHGLSEDDVDGPGVDDDVVKTVEGFGRCAFLTMLTSLLRDAFGVEAVFERNPGSANRANVRYFGPSGRAALAVYAHRVVVRAVDAAWAEHLDHHPWNKGKGGKRTAFRLGWLTAVRAQIERIGFTDVERGAIERWKARKFGGALVTQKARPLRIDAEGQRAARAGAEAGKGFRLHRPVGTDSETGPRLALEKLSF